jgi:hypothetical protein
VNDLSDLKQTQFGGERYALQVDWDGIEGQTIGERAADGDGSQLAAIYQQLQQMATMERDIVVNADEIVITVAQVPVTVRDDDDHENTMEVNKPVIMLNVDAPNANVPMQETGSGLMLPSHSVATSNLSLSLTANAHMQLAGRYPIGTRYAKVLLEGDYEDATLLARNLNHWLGRDSKRRVTLRLYGDLVRAVLGGGYRIMDNFDLFNACQEPLHEVGAEVTQLTLNQDRFYIRALIDGWREPVRRQNTDVQERREVFQSWHANGDLSAYMDRGAQFQDIDDEDWIVPGMNARNSETGKGGLSVAPFALRVICMNGTTMDAVVSKRHVGRQNELGWLLSDDTRQKADELLWSEVKDLVRATFDREKFMEMMARMNAAANDPIEKPIDAVAEVASKYSISEQAQQDIINNLITGGDPTRWGLINAVTATAHGIDSTEEQQRIQRIGGQMLEAVPVRSQAV